MSNILIFRRGHINASLNEGSFDQKLFHAGVPLEYHGARVEDVSFLLHHEDVEWKNQRLPEHKPAAAFKYTTAKQIIHFNELVGAIRASGKDDIDVPEGQVLFADFMPSSMVITSPFNDHTPKTMAAALVNEAEKSTALMEKAGRPGIKVLWHDVNRRTKWGDIEVPKEHKELPVPDLVVLNGLKPSPSKDLRDAVDVWYNWAQQYATMICLVGAGAEPFAMLDRWYHIDVKYGYYTYGASKRAKTYG